MIRQLITKPSKNIKKVNEVSEDITKEVKIIDKSNDVDKIAKNTRKMKLIKNEQTLDDILTKKNPDFKVINAKYGNDNGIEHMLKNEKTGELIITPIEIVSKKSKK